MTENQKEVEKIKTKIVFFVKLKNWQTGGQHKKTRLKVPKLEL